MKPNHIEEITLVMCECCFDLSIESESKELKGVSYCPNCADMEVPPYYPI